MSKRVVLGLVKRASKGLGQYGIRVNSVAPGPMATTLRCDAMKKRADEVEKALEPDFLLKGREILKVKHVADAALFLASDDSEFVTGHNLAIDAGYAPVVPRFNQNMVSKK